MYQEQGGSLVIHGQGALNPLNDPPSKFDPPELQLFYKEYFNTSFVSTLYYDYKKQYVCIARVLNRTSITYNT